MVQDETPPKVPLSVGFWTLKSEAGIGHWDLFGDPRASALIGRLGDGNRSFASESVLREIHTNSYSVGTE
jgi:hypothetical protein